MNLKTYLPKIVVVSFFLLLGAVAFAFATADVTLNRAPAPPQTVVNDGTGVVTYDYSIVYDSNADRVEVTVMEPDGVTQLGATVVQDLEPDLVSPAVGNGTITVPAGSPVGDYTIKVLYFTDTDIDAGGPTCTATPNVVPNSPLACIEDSATVTFSVVAPPVVIDLCTNIPGDQTAVPDGYTATGTVCTKAPVDVCKNIVGLQITVPAGYVLTDGQCAKKITQPPVVHRPPTVTG